MYLQKKKLTTLIAPAIDKHKNSVHIQYHYALLDFSCTVQHIEPTDYNGAHQKTPHTQDPFLNLVPILTYQ